MRRAPTSKYKKLTEIKQRARELGWQTKGESDEESSHSDSESMEPCWKWYFYNYTCFAKILMGNSLTFFVVPSILVTPSHLQSTCLPRGSGLQAHFQAVIRFPGGSRGIELDHHPHTWERCVVCCIQCGQHETWAVDWAAQGIEVWISRGKSESKFYHGLCLWFCQRWFWCCTNHWFWWRT